MSDRLIRTLRVASAFMLAFFSSGIAQIYQAPTAAADSAGKVFVCKYSSTPGYGEKAQTVNSVGIASHNYKPGDYFTDAQGASYVISYDVGQPAPSPLSCPITGYTVLDLPTVTSTDPCNPSGVTSNVAWGAYSNDTGYTWTLNADGSLTVNAASGYQFKDSNGYFSTSHTYTLPADSGVQCPPAPVEIPAAPALNDPCGLNNATWTKPANSTEITWSVVNGELIASTTTGHVFTDGTTTHNYGVATDSGTLCTVPVPEPVPTDPCGANNATWTQPTNTASITWSIVNGELIATTTADYTFTDGSTTHNFGTAPDTGDLCVVPLPEAPAPTDPCGLNNATWTKPANSATVTWTVVNGHLIATAATDYQFDNGERTHDYGVAMDSGILCTTPLPDAPKPTDPCGLNNATWTKPANTTEVTWSVDANGHLIASTTANYQFPDGSKTHDYGVAPDSKVLCETPVPDAPGVTDPCNPYGVTHNASWTVPSNTAEVTWALDATTGELVATTTANYKFTDGTTTHNYGVAHDSGKACDTAAPTASSAAGTCDTVKTTTTNEGSAKVTITNTHDTYGAPATYTWTLTGNGANLSGTTASVADGATGTVTLSGLAAGSYSFAYTGSDGTHGMTTVVVEACPLEAVTPAVPEILDFCYTEGDAVVIPEKTGVAYYVNGKLTPAGTFVSFTGAPIRITAVALTGYVLDESATTVWNIDSSSFTNKQCIEITKNAQTPTDTNSDGVIGVGDTITWTITVKNNGSTALDESFFIQLLDQGATFVNPAQATGTLLPGESKTVTVQKTVTTEEALACKATNTATFNAWLVRPENLLDPMYTGSATATAQIDCLHKVTVTQPTITSITRCGMYGSILMPTVDGVTYTLTSGDGKQGAYTVTATLKAGYIWDDMTTTPKTFTGNLGAYTVCPLPGKPVLPTPAPCTAVFGGQTIRYLDGGDISVRDKFGNTTGEVNADGWGTTYRLYGATSTALANVTFTATAAQGMTFKPGSFGTVITGSASGMGALYGGGYTAAVTGLGTPVLSADGKTVTLTIANMPAHSAFAFAVDYVLDGSNLPMVINEQMTGGIVGCTVPSGEILGETIVKQTPVTVIKQVLAATTPVQTPVILPATGKTTDMLQALFGTLFLSTLTYGAVYFLQRKRA